MKSLSGSSKIAIVAAVLFVLVLGWTFVEDAMRSSSDEKLQLDSPSAQERGTPKAVTSQDWSQAEREYIAALEFEVFDKIIEDEATQQDFVALGREACEAGDIDATVDILIDSGFSYQESEAMVGVAYEHLCPKRMRDFSDR